MRKKIAMLRRKLINRLKNEKEWTLLGPEQEVTAKEAKRPQIPDNPCIPYMRAIVEALLRTRHQDYRDFFPVLLDFDDPMEEPADTFSLETKIDEDDAIAKYELETQLQRVRGQMEEVLYLLAPGLNQIVIRTNRPAYFEEFVQTMYEETGLLVQTEEKERQPFPSGSTVLDFEIAGTIDVNGLRENILYLPIYKKPWEIAGNLDIIVPIGYNTVIVKGAIPQEEEGSVPDRFEREFYEN